MRLGINIDHVATLRQARGTDYPDPLKAALVAKEAGADLITLHLREDRRHIQDMDVIRIRKAVDLPMNFEMANTDAMRMFALDIKPAWCCIVPESREERTTEGGLDVLKHAQSLKTTVLALQLQGIKVSLFIEPELKQIEAAKSLSVDAIELHTGAYADLWPNDHAQVLERLQVAAKFSSELGIQVHAGHGLSCENVTPICKIKEIEELNIGHSLVADAIFDGLGNAIERMRQLIQCSR